MNLFFVRLEYFVHLLNLYFQRISQRFRQEGEAVLFALSAANMQLTVREMYITDTQTYQLG